MVSDIYEPVRNEKLYYNEIFVQFMGHESSNVEALFKYENILVKLHAS